MYSKSTCKGRRECNAKVYVPYGTFSHVRACLFATFSRQRPLRYKLWPEAQAGGATATAEPGNDSPTVVLCAM